MSHTNSGDAREEDPGRGTIQQGEGGIPVDICRGIALDARSRPQVELFLEELGVEFVLLDSFDKLAVKTCVRVGVGSD